MESKGVTIEQDVGATDSADIGGDRNDAAASSGGRARDSFALSGGTDRLPEYLTHPYSIEAESIRALRTRIIAQHVREGRRALALCTPSSGSGCSYVSVNLAAALAQVDIKVALVDCDLRAPSVGTAFGIPADHTGLADYLDDDMIQLDQIIVEDRVPGLAIIPAGYAAPNSQELLSGHRFRYLVSRLMREYELTLFDTTPANSCTDAQRVGTVSGYSLIVARKHQSYVNDVATLAKLLRADRSVVVGAVLNEY